MPGPGYDPRGSGRARRAGQAINALLGLDHSGFGNTVDVGIFKASTTTGYVLTSAVNIYPVDIIQSGLSQWQSPITGTVLVECWGPGGNADGSALFSVGGGGGEYRADSIAVVQGTFYNIFVGDPALGYSYSAFNDTSVVANGGANGTVQGDTPGVGGSGGTGATGHNGGDGSKGDSVTDDGGGGAGGASAGPLAVGGPGSDGIGGDGGAGGVAPAGGGDGGAGGTSSDGHDGVFPGGGGGGPSLASANSGKGAKGRVRITVTTTDNVSRWAAPAGNITGTGTANHLSKWITASTQGDSSFSDDGAGTIAAGDLSTATNFTVLASPASGKIVVSNTNGGIYLSADSYVNADKSGLYNYSNDAPLIEYSQADEVYVAYGTVRVFIGAPATLLASTTATASVNIPPGTAPTSPVNGDLWWTATGVFARVNGATVQLDLAGTVTSVSGTANQVNVATGTTTPVISLIGPHGFTTQTNHGVLIGQGTSAIVATAVMTDGQLLVGQSAADPLPKTISGAFTMAASGAATIATPGTCTVSSTNSTATAHTHAITSSAAPGGAASLLATNSSGGIGATATPIVKIDVSLIADKNTGGASTFQTNSGVKVWDNSTGFGSQQSAASFDGITVNTTTGAKTGYGPVWVNYFSANLFYFGPNAAAPYFDCSLTTPTLVMQGFDIQMYAGGGAGTGGGKLKMDGGAIEAAGAINAVASLTASQLVVTDGSKNLASAGTKLPSSIVTTADLTGQTATASSVVTVTSPNDGSAHQYSIGAYINVTAISAGTVTVTYTFTDENNVSQTLTLFPMGLTSATISATGFIAFPSSTIRVKANTVITMVATFTGVSVSYDTGGWIQQLN